MSDKKCNNIFTDNDIQRENLEIEANSIEIIAHMCENGIVRKEKEYATKFSF